MDPKREVVITGLGVVSPIGIGKDAFWSSLCEQRSGVGQRKLFSDFNGCYRIGAELKDFDPQKYIKPRKSLKLMCREMQMGYAAAAMAMEDAGLAVGQYDPDRLGIVLGSELFYCDIQEVEPAYRSCSASGTFDYNLWGDRAMQDIFPLWMLKHLPNMAACHIGIGYDARGPNNTIVSDEVSSLNAIVEAVEVISRGHADVMITGGTGASLSLTTMIYRGELNLSKRIEDPAAACRPFDAARDGMVVGEGAGSFVLEHLPHAQARGAKILAHLLGYGQNFGADTETGRIWAIRQSIQSALRSARLEPADIGHVNAHGRSTVKDDILEATAIRQSLGEVPVTAPKSFFGYLGAGGGAVEMAVSVLAFVHREVPVTLNYEQPDPKCAVNVIHAKPYRSETQTAIVLTQSWTGQATALAMAGP